MVEILTIQGVSDELVGQVASLCLSEEINLHSQGRLAQRGSCTAGKRWGGRENSMLYVLSVSPPTGPLGLFSALWNGLQAQAKQQFSLGRWPVAAPVCPFEAQETQDRRVPWRAALL